MEPHDLERIRRSIAMLSPGQRIGPLTREEALDLIGELQSNRAEANRYRTLHEQLRRMLEELDVSP